MDADILVRLSSLENALNAEVAARQALEARCQAAEMTACQLQNQVASLEVRLQVVQ